MAIPYIKDIEFEYGVVQQMTPLIRRVIANNPGPFTYVGTGVYIIGRGEVAVIDPGPELAEHFEALKQALEMKLRQTHTGGDLAQRRLAPGVSVQETDGLFYQLVIVCGHRRRPPR